MVETQTVSRTKVERKGHEAYLVILEDWCKGCGFCVEFCPKQVLELSGKFNVKGYHPPYVKNPENCILCQLCELYCPEFAIYQESDDESLSKQECTL
ncbi:ferredoxin family protein [bacterium]|nr:ferredoxin family protein [bacterium]